jgi:hypothetical protein
MGSPRPPPPSRRIKPRSIWCPIARSKALSDELDAYGHGATVLNRVAPMATGDHALPSDSI